MPKVQIVKNPQLNYKQNSNWKLVLNSFHRNGDVLAGFRPQIQNVSESLIRGDWKLMFYLSLP